MFKILIPCRGEYTSKDLVECCGDDAGETLVNTFCDGSSDNEPVCCPTIGNWKIFNGACVSECPDIQRIPPVWIQISGREWLALNTLLENDGDSNTYCCSPLITEGNLCDTPAIQGEYGCFLDTQEAYNEGQNAEDVYRFWCNDKTPDDYCLQGSNMNLFSFEPSTVCNESITEVTNAENLLICYDTQREISYENCRTLLPENCTEDDVLNLNTNDCVEITEIRKNPVASSCEALCSITGDKILCEEICSDYENELITTYRGNCLYTEFCDPSNAGVESCQKTGNPKIKPSTICENFCENGNCQTGWFMKESECVEIEVISDPTPASFCRNVDNQGERYQIIDADGDVLYCNSIDNINYGDPWCPLNFVYDEFDTKFCVKTTEVCDQGFNGQLMYGCNNPYDPNDDELFHQYQKECLNRSIYAPPTIDVYDMACCYDSVFNGFEIYQWGRKDSYIKIY